MASLAERITMVAHADWSVNPGKRWIAIARRIDGGWAAGVPNPVGEPSNLLARMHAASIGDGCILIGFDYPIGLPEAYASRAGINDFLEWLPVAGREEWMEFYQPAQESGQISLSRPFYPAVPGGARREHLEAGLGIGFAGLYRLCELPHPARRAACPLFWTLGGQQVGKAAISGWREVLSPGLRDPQQNLAIWPFSGHLVDLLIQGKVVVAETYPAEYYPQLGIQFSPPRPGEKTGKRSQADRARAGEALLTFASRRSLDLDARLMREIAEGFGTSPAGEDPFDAVVGLFGMLQVVENWHPGFEPEGETCRKIEGWIFGQTFTGLSHGM